jgi:4-amino-4-deoxy-L-arabinose transferase-like glycosyltransferase
MESAGARDRVCLTAILLAWAALYLTSPMSGDFSWSDAPRHALNGVFVKDAALDRPFSDPAGYAKAYYLRYPALTILFYPPLFYLISAPFYLLLGDRHAVAQLVVAIHGVMLGFGMFALARLWFGRALALAAALLLVTLPEIALWGRQVMLEIPSLAYLVWSTFFLVRYGREGRARDLLVGAAILVAAMWTKLNCVFVLPAFAWYLLRARGVGVLREPSTWRALGIGLVGVAPLIGMTIAFGQPNVQSVVSVPDSPATRDTVTGWVWYLAQLPRMAGIVPLLLAAVGATSWFLSSMARRPERRQEGRENELLAFWFLATYLALSFISLKEHRQGVLLLAPLAVAAVAGVQALGRLAPVRARGAATAGLALAVVVGLGSWIVARQTVPRVGGYRGAAALVARNAEPGTRVLFSGMRDGSFIFNLRSMTPRRDIHVVRADKLLLQITVSRERGVTQENYSEADIAQRLHELGISMVVAQRDFWTDLDQMKKLQSVLDGPGYEEIARVPVLANVPTEDRELRVYRATAPRVGPLPDLGANLKMMGQEVGE